MLSTKLNRERNQFWLLHLNSDVVKSFDVLADNEYIRIIEEEESIADVLYSTYHVYEEFDVASIKSSVVIVEK